jgi:hypothetical protein
MHIVSALAYKIVTAARQDKRPNDGPVIFRLIGEQAARDEPVVIKRIVGPHSNGEPIIVNRAPAEDNSVPWVTRRNGEGAETYFEWEWKDRTEDDPGDAYYKEANSDVIFRGRRIKAHCRPQRWWKFKRLSQNDNGDDHDRMYSRR